MYVELITRITTQPLVQNKGDEATALESIYNIFEITREILKSEGKKAKNFTKIAIVVLNQMIRPFTAKWHKKCWMVHLKILPNFKYSETN